MMAVILAGGKGTRLHPFTITIPKPLLPLGEVPILEVVMRQLEAAGVDRIVLTLGHMAHLFTAVLGDASRWRARIEYCVEDEPLGTAGALRVVNHPDETMLVMNGDVLTTLDYRELLAVHRDRQAWGTIAMSHREVKVDYGVVVSGADGTLTEYREKPVIQYDVSMGINVLSARCLEYVPRGAPFDMPDLMETMRRAGRTVICHRTESYWRDIGHFDDYVQASEDFAKDPGRFLPPRGGA